MTSNASIVIILWKFLVFFVSKYALLIVPILELACTKPDRLGMELKMGFVQE